MLIVSNLVISTLGFNFYSGRPSSVTLVKYGNFIMEASRKVGLVVMQRVLRASPLVSRSPPHANGDATGTSNSSTGTGNRYGGSVSPNRAHPGPRARQLGGGGEHGTVA